MSDALTKLKQRHSELRDRDGEPITALAAAKFLAHGTPDGTRAAREQGLGQIKLNIAVLEKVGQQLPLGERRAALKKCVAELRARVAALERR